MGHTKVVNALEEHEIFENVPEQNIEACKDTLDNFVLEYCSSDNLDKFFALPETLIRSFCVLGGLFENSDREIKKSITIDTVVETVKEHYANFRKIHGENVAISNEDARHFDKQMVELFLE